MPSAVHLINLPLDPALTLPDSLCAHEYLYLRFNGLVVYLIKLFYKIAQLF